MACRNEFAGTLFDTEKEMVIAMVAEWVSAGGSNSRAEVIEYLGDWSGLLAELRKAWELSEDQEELLHWYADEQRINASDVLERLYDDEDDDSDDAAGRCIACEGKGWDIFETDKDPCVLEVERCDDCGTFADDLEAGQAAVAWVNEMNSFKSQEHMSKGWILSHIKLLVERMGSRDPDDVERRAIILDLLKDLE